MKNLLVFFICAVPLMSNAQFASSETNMSDFYAGHRAFDVAIHFTADTRTNQDASIAVQVGVSGRRLPISLLAGVRALEFDDDYERLGLQYQSLHLAPSALLMIRLAHINFRSSDLYAYTSSSKVGKNIFMENGCKIGLLINDRTRGYLKTGYMFNQTNGKDRQYNSFVIGACFSLFFFNGYDAY